MTSKIFQANHQNRWLNAKIVTIGGPVTGPLETNSQSGGFNNQTVDDHHQNDILGDQTANTSQQNGVFDY